MYTYIYNTCVRTYRSLSLYIYIYIYTFRSYDIMVVSLYHIIIPDSRLFKSTRSASAPRFGILRIRFPDHTIPYHTIVYYTILYYTIPYQATI